MPKKQPQGVAIALDPEDLTIGELEIFEEVCGEDLFKILPKNAKEAEAWSPSAKVLLAFVYIAKRRTNPEFTLDDARNVKVTELDLTGGAEGPSLQAAG